MLAVLKRVEEKQYLPFPSCTIRKEEGHGELSPNTNLIRDLLTLLATPTTGAVTSSKQKHLKAWSESDKHSLLRHEPAR